MNTLPRAYRAALLCYPRRWREERGTELIGLLLDSADDKGRHRADPWDLLNLAAHGLRTRLTLRNPVTSPAARDHAALLAAATGFALCAALVLFGELQVWIWSPVETHLTLAGPLYLTWMLGVALAIAGRSSLGRMVLALTGLGFALLPVIASVTGHDRPRRWLLLFLVLLCCLAVSGRLAPDRASRRLLILLAGGATAVAVPVIGGFLHTRFSPDGFYSANEQYNLSFFAFGALGVAAVLRQAGHRAWAGAVAVNGLVWLSLVLLSPVGYRSGVELTASLAFAAGAVAASSGVLLTRRARTRVRLRGEAGQ